MNEMRAFTHIRQGCFIDTGAIVGLPHSNEANLKDMD